jgi:flagellar basal body-associated protein FliL
VTELVDLLVRAIPIMLGGGAVQIAIFLLKRRQEMRAADVAMDKTGHEADAVVVASAERSLLLSDQARDRAVKRAEQLMADLQHAESELAAAAVENRDLRVELAARDREVAQLRARQAETAT